jgi:mono/diheme cytochrome c family protein
MVYGNRSHLPEIFSRQVSFQLMFKTCVLIAGLVGPLVSTAPAHDIITTKLTYTRDISRIFNRRCVSCHAAGSSIPLASYEEVRPWAVDIKEQVISRTMPPWGAVKGFGDLAPDMGLSQEEVLIIAAWVVGGAPQGEPALLPKESTSPPPPKADALTDALAVFTSTTLGKPLKLAGIKPGPDSPVNSARITARLPDGRIQPLVWLYHYDPKWARTFRFREPISLPAGTTIEANAPLRYTLEIQSALTGMVKATVSTTPLR